MCSLYSSFTLHLLTFLIQPNMQFACFTETVWWDHGFNNFFSTTIPKCFSCSLCWMIVPLSRYSQDYLVPSVLIIYHFAVLNSICYLLAQSEVKPFLIFIALLVLPLILVYAILEVLFSIFFFKSAGYVSRELSQPVQEINVCVRKKKNHLCFHINLNILQ